MTHDLFAQSRVPKLYPLLQSLQSAKPKAAGTLTARRGSSIEDSGV